VCSSATCPLAAAAVKCADDLRRSAPRGAGAVSEPEQDQERSSSHWQCRQQQVLHKLSNIRAQHATSCKGHAPLTIVLFFPIPRPGKPSISTNQRRRGRGNSARMQAHAFRTRTHGAARRWPEVQGSGGGGGRKADVGGHAHSIPFPSPASPPGPCRGYG